MQVAIDARAEARHDRFRRFLSGRLECPDGRTFHRYDWGNQVKTVGLSRDGTLSVCRAQRERSIYDLQSGDVKAVIPLEYENFTVARFTPDAQQLMLGTFRGDLPIGLHTSDARPMGYRRLHHPSRLARPPRCRLLDMALRGWRVNW